MATMHTFQIEFDTRRRDWVLKAHPLINHADLHFGNDSRPGLVGLIGAAHMVLMKVKRTGGTIEARHREEAMVPYDLLTTCGTPRLVDTSLQGEFWRQSD